MNKRIKKSKEGIPTIGDFRVTDVNLKATFFSSSPLKFLQKIKEVEALGHKMIISHDIEVVRQLI